MSPKPPNHRFDTTLPTPCHRTEEAVEEIAERHRQHEIPCDALWLDIEYMDGYRVFTWNTNAFPDVAGMLKRLTDSGFRVITIVDPGVKHDPGYWVFDQAVERDVLCKTEGSDVYIGSGPATRRSRTSSLRRPVPGRAS